jgi:hypothetical protein
MGAGTSRGTGPLDTFVVGASIQKQFEKELAHWFLCSNTPAARAADKKLQRALALGGLAAPTRRQIMERHLPQLYDECRERVISRLGSAQRVTMAMDGWKKGCAGGGSPLINILLLLPSGGSVFWDVINAAGHTKDSQYIKQCCVDLMGELRTSATGVHVLGFVMDSASANRSALSLLQHDFPKLVNLPCISHALALLLKDMAKHFGWIQATYDAGVAVSNAQQTEAISHMLQQSMRAQPSKTAFSIASHSETRFGSRHIVLRTVMRALQPLKEMVATAAFDRLLRGSNSANAKKLHAVVTSIEDNSLPALGQRLLSLGDSIMDAIHQLEADRPLLSRVLPMIWQLEEVAVAFQAEHHDLAQGWKKARSGAGPGEQVDMIAVFDRRLRNFLFRDCFAAAFVLDPVNFIFDSDTNVWRLPFARLSESEKDGVRTNLKRMGGDKAEAEWDELLLRNLPGDSSCVRAFTRCAARTEDVTGRIMVADVELRRNVWVNFLRRGKNAAGQTVDLYPSLADIAVVYMSVHATACAPERNWSKWGNLYDKKRNALDIQRGKQIIFLQENDAEDTVVAEGEELLFSF